MAFIRSLSAALLVAATSAQSSFSKVKAQLEANITLQPNDAWHLGGFCFRQADEDTTKAAEVRVHVQWEGQKRLNEIGPVKLLAFDASEHRWGAVRDTWGKQACDDKLDSANMVRVLNETKIKFNFLVTVHQTSAPRDWHFALLTCGDVERSPLTITLEALKGAKNMFGANTNFDSSSCPIAEIPWIAAAQDDAGFWLLLLAALVTGCSAALAVMLCRQFHSKSRKGQAEAEGLANLPPPAISGAEAVIGRPCTQVGEEKIVDGQVNGSSPELREASSPERSTSAAAPDSDSCV